MFFRSKLSKKAAFLALASTSACLTPPRVLADTGEFIRLDIFPVAGLFQVDMAGADLDLDGDTDMVTVDVNADSFTVFTNDGDGVYTPTTTAPTGDRPANVTFADFNGDGDEDFVLTYSTAGDNLSILLGGPGATFQAETPITVPNAVGSVCVVDINGDGDLDIAATAGSDDSIMILLGDGAGGFDPAIVTPVGTNPNYLAEGDLNNDGVPDLVVSNFDDATYNELLGAGDGTFTVLPAIALPSDPRDARHLKIADIDNDGVQDILIVYNGQDPFRPPTRITGLLLVQFRAIGGSVVTSRFHYAGAVPRTLEVVDYNLDGDPDAVTSSNGGVNLFRGSGNRAVMPREFRYEDFNSGVVIGDLTGDGEINFAALDPVDEAFGVWRPNSPDFDADQAVGSSDLAFMLGAWGSSLADINADGTTDSQDLAVFLSQWGPCP